ncbi:MAG TPA: flavodoxin [Actinoplanes sp.]|nr:flavodoxin [Actinoplanes sp.]
MQALVVYESMFGNSETIARAVVDGLTPYLPATAVEVATAPTVLDDSIGLLVVGGPTHAFSMSRPGTRRSAAEQSAVGVISTGIGIREWLGRTQVLTTGLSAAAFDTRVSGANGRPKVPGSAAHSAARKLRGRSLRMITAPTSFYVCDTTGPLRDGEVERARAWAGSLGAQLRRATDGTPAPG